MNVEELRKELLVDFQALLVHGAVVLRPNEVQAGRALVKEGFCLIDEDDGTTFSVFPSPSTKRQIMEAIAS